MFIGQTMTDNTWYLCTLGRDPTLSPSQTLWIPTIVHLFNTGTGPHKRYIVAFLETNKGIISSDQKGPNAYVIIQVSEGPTLHSSPLTLECSYTQINNQVRLHDCSREHLSRLHFCLCWPSKTKKTCHHTRTLTDLWSLSDHGYTTIRMWSFTCLLHFVFWTSLGYVSKSMY